MNDKQILDRLESINLSLRQKKDLIDIIKDIAGNNNSNDNGFNDNDFIIVKYAGSLEYNNFDLYINNKLCNLHHYDNYSENEYDIIDTELFNLFNTFKRILIYISFDNIFKIKSTTGYEFSYMDTGDGEMFNLSYKVLGNDIPLKLHIKKNNLI